MQKSIKCYECNKNIFKIQLNPNYIWKDQEICEYCWYNHSHERNELIEKINLYKPKVECYICCIKKSYDTQRFHYDHINMFDKNKCIFTMINEGCCIEDIYKELNKCQVLCISCHNIITNIENKLGFTQIKIRSTINKNNDNLEENKKIYEEKMKEIYEKIKFILQKKDI